MRWWWLVAIGCAVWACGSSDDDGAPDAPADAPPDAPAETPAETLPESEVPGDTTPDVSPEDGGPLGPCALAGGTCRGLVAGCAACPAGEAPAQSTVRCPPESYCCLPFTPPDPLPECLEHGGVCFPASSGSECPTGWMREGWACIGPAGCCVPGDACA